MKDFAEILGLLVMGVFGIILIAVLTALPVMWMWNYLMPDLFGLKTIDFWQALVLSGLCGTLFKPNSSSSSKKS